MILCALLLLLAAVGANSCSKEATCSSCLANKSCAYVFASLPGKETKAYMCIDNKATRHGITISLRIRSPDHCAVADADNEATEMTGLSPTHQTAGEMLKAVAEMECPVVTPLMIAFFILSLLLAVVLSVVTTIGCWVTCCGGDDTDVQCNRKSSISQDHEMANKL